jgi:hypothetical protein
MGLSQNPVEAQAFEFSSKSLTQSCIVTYIFMRIKKCPDQFVEKSRKMCHNPYIFCQK